MFFLLYRKKSVPLHDFLEKKSRIAKRLDKYDTNSHSIIAGLTDHP